MPSRRVLKAAEAVREVVSWAILTELNDPRVRDVTVTYVEMSGDLRQAKVHVSVMGDLAHQELSLRGLKNAAGFLQSKLSDRIDTRYTPRLEFVLDQGVKRSIEVSRILKEVLPQNRDEDLAARQMDENVDEREDLETNEEHAEDAATGASSGDEPDGDATN
ncbi:MAG: 30S ribosome-binding factor RbfA [Pirellulales bacterium]|nr:30S ribosome-binding factor RbfA [Pirellulales bacterium]